MSHQRKALKHGSQGKNLCGQISWINTFLESLKRDVNIHPLEIQDEIQLSKEMRRNILDGLKYSVVSKYMWVPCMSYVRVKNILFGQLVNIGAFQMAADVFQCRWIVSLRFHSHSKGYCRLLNPTVVGSP